MLDVINFLLQTVPAVLAQLDPHLIPESGVLGPGCSFITGEMHFHCVPLYLAYLIQLVFSFIGTICLLMIIRAGYEFVAAGFQGDTSNAKKTLQNALLGLAFCVFSYLMVETIISALLL